MAELPMRLSAKCISAVALIYSTVTTDSIGMLAGIVCKECGTLNKPFKRDSKCIACGEQSSLRMASASKHKSIWSCGEFKKNGSQCSHQPVDDEASTDVPGCDGFSHAMHVHMCMMKQVQTLAKAIWFNVSKTLMASYGGASTEKELIHTLTRDLYKVINKAHIDIKNESYPNWRKLTEVLTLASPDHIASIRTMFIINPSSMATFTTNQETNCDIIYALLPDETTKQLVNRSLENKINTRRWWPEHSFNKKVELECALSEIHDMISDPVLEVKDSFARLIATRASNVNKEFLLPSCRDTLAITPNILKMLHCINSFPNFYREVDETDLLPGEVNFYSLHSTPIPKNRTIEVRTALSNSTLLNLETKFSKKHPLAQKHLITHGFHPLQTRASQAKIMGKKANYSIKQDDSLQRAKWYSYHDRVLEIDSSLWMKETLPVENISYEPNDGDTDEDALNDGVLHPDKKKNYKFKRARDSSYEKPDPKNSKKDFEAMFTIEDWLVALELLPFAHTNSFQ